MVTLPSLIAAAKKKKKKGVISFRCSSLILLISPYCSLLSFLGWGGAEETLGEINRCYRVFCKGTDTWCFIY